MKKKLIILLIICLSEHYNLHCSNEITLQSYESKIEECIKTIPPITVEVKKWLNHALSYIKKEDAILEIGSGIGQDAKYIESKGYKVQTSEGAKGFVEVLKKQGFQARVLNILNDAIDKDYNLIFANRVFLHFTPEELEKILNKIYQSLKYQGILAFSVKYGEGSEWFQGEIDAPRYYCYWKPRGLEEILRKTKFELINIAVNYEGPFKLIYVIAKKAK